MLGRIDEAIKGRCEQSFPAFDPDRVTDLRALLKLQPNNTEAVAELVSLLPPDPSISPNTSASSSSSAPPSSPARQHPNLPKLRPPKALPFDRTEADDRKLKIVALPLSYDTSITFEFMAAAAAAGFGDQSGGSNGNGKGKMKRPHGGIHLPHFPDMFTKGKGRKMSFAYPNWERYVVKRVSD
jgi:RNA polymerase II-associated protein 3